MFFMQQDKTLTPKFIDFSMGTQIVPSLETDKFKIFEDLKSLGRVFCQLNAYGNFYRENLFQIQCNLVASKLYNGNYTTISRLVSENLWLKFN